MKLLSDFDGVWTYPEAEGVAHGAALDAALEAVLGEGERAAVRDWIARARAALRAEPTRWGWTAAGRISAFADEDPFTEHGALLHFLESSRASDPLAARLAAAVEERDGSLDALGGRAHVGGVRDVEAKRGPGITADAAQAGRELLARGVDVVVVSNSGTEKLKRWFDHAGLPNTIHPEHADGALRLRGSARKFVLAPGPVTRSRWGGCASTWNAHIMKRCCARSGPTRSSGTCSRSTSRCRSRSSAAIPRGGTCGSSGWRTRTRRTGSGGRSRHSQRAMWK
jgi:hypothetical protein